MQLYDLAYQRLFTCIPSRSTSSLITFALTDWSLSKNCCCLSILSLSMRRMTRLLPSSRPLSSISMKPSLYPCLTKALRCVARPRTYQGEVSLFILCTKRGSELRTLGGKLRPRQRAHAIEDFPVPLGPKTMLRCGPGRNSTSS